MRQFCTAKFPENVALCTVAFRVQSHTTVARVCTCTYSIPFFGCGPDFSFMVCSNHHTHNMHTTSSFQLVIQFPSLFISFSILHSPLPLPPSINPPPLFCSFPPFLFIPIPLCPSLLFCVLTQRFMI